MPAHRIHDDAYQAAITEHNIIPDNAATGGTFNITKKSGCRIPLTSSAAKTATLDRPIQKGVEVILEAVDITTSYTITVTGGYNGTGDTSLAFTINGGLAVLRSIDVNGTLRWDLQHASLVTGPSTAYGEQGTPGTVTAAATLTVAQLLGGIITGTQSSGSTNALTLPTGTVMDAGVTMAVDQYVDVTIINLSAALADTYTLTAATGFTIVGMAIVDSAHADSEFPSSATYRLRKTAANTFVAYRMS